MSPALHRKIPSKPDASTSTSSPFSFTNPPRSVHTATVLVHPDHAKMSHDTSAVLVGEVEFPSLVVAWRSSAGAHDHQMLHREGDADAEAGQAIPATTSIGLDPEPTQVQPSLPTPSSTSAVPETSSSIQQHSHPLAAGSSGNAGHNGVTISSPDTPLSFFSAVSNLAADAANPISHSIGRPGGVASYFAL